MKIKFLYHSGIAIEKSNVIILIDPIRHFSHYKNKQIYCFITHSHSDHYNQEIRQLEEYNDVTYVISEDVQRVPNSITVKKGDTIDLEPLSIEVFGTTDLGVSYLIEIDHKVFFHSGDLNWWHWPNDSEKVQLDEKRQYMSEIKALENRHVDYVFVPVDPRLKAGHRYAMDYFIKTVKPNYLIPIHFGDAFDNIRNLETKSNTKLMIPKEENCNLMN